MSKPVETPEQTKDRMFNYLIDTLMRLDKSKMRFIVIEYECSFRSCNFDPYHVAAFLMTKGYTIVYDDASISREANKKKKEKVETYYKTKFGGF